MTDRGRCIALLILTSAMLLVCFEQMGSRPLKQADLAATTPVAYRINVNQVDRDTLTLLPGIAQGKARRVVATRQALGRFHEPNDLINVPMIGPKTADALTPWIRFD